MLYAIKTPEGWVRNKPNGRKYEFSKKLNDARVFNRKGAAENAKNFVRYEHFEWKLSDIEVRQIAAIELM